MARNEKQMNMNFGSIDLPGVGQICASFATEITAILLSDNVWQSGAIWLSGETQGGQEEVAKSWAKDNNAELIDASQTRLHIANHSKNIVILNANYAEEQALLSLLVLAETGEIRLLLAANLLSNEFEVASADLASRLRNLTNLQMPELTRSLAVRIISKSLSNARISCKVSYLEDAISKLNLNFVMISKLISFIVNKLAISSKLSKAELSATIDEFIKTNRTPDLFDDK